jgi:hypothetical protein
LGREAEYFSLSAFWRIDYAKTWKCKIICKKGSKGKNMQKDLMNAVSLLSEKQLLVLACASVSAAIKEARSKNAEHGSALTEFYSSWTAVERNIERTLQEGKEPEETNAIQRAASSLSELLNEQIMDLQQEMRRVQALNSSETLLQDFLVTETGKSLQRAWMALLNEDTSSLVKMVYYAENQLPDQALHLFLSIVQESGIKVITSGDAERSIYGERNGAMIFVYKQLGLKLSYHQPRGKNSEPVYKVAAVEGRLIEDRYFGTRFQQTSSDDTSEQAVKAISSLVVKTLRAHYVPEESAPSDARSKFVFVNLDDLQPAALEAYQATECNLGDTIVVLNSAPGKRIFYQHSFICNYVPDDKVVSPVMVFPGPDGKIKGQPSGTDIVHAYKPNQKGRMSIYVQEMDINTASELPVKVINLEVS